MRTRSALVVLTLALPLLLAGCLLLSPDTEPAAYELRFVARADTETAAKAPCALPGDLLLENPGDADPSHLWAEATIYALDDLGVPATPLSVVPLAVSAVEGGARTLSGDIDFEAQQGGPGYVLDVSLYYQGATNRTIEGTYTGDIRLSSGLDVAVNEMRIDPVESSIIVSAAGLVSDRTAIEIDYDGDANQLVASYTSEAFVWEGETERGRVEMTARFAPSLIYRARVRLQDILPGSQVEPEALELEPQGDPLARLHMVLEGSLRVFLPTAPPNVEETGAVRLFRQGTVCD